MAAAGRAKQTPAQLDEELQLLIDSELGHPRRRTTTARRDRGDRDAVFAIAEAMRNPVWDTALLEEICDILRDTGREVSGPPLAVMAS
jgi:hypothetical protein